MGVWYSCYVSSRFCRWINVPSDFSLEAALYVMWLLCKEASCGETKENFLQSKVLGVAVALYVTVYMWLPITITLATELLGWTSSASRQTFCCLRENVSWWQRRPPLSESFSSSTYLLVFPVCGLWPWSLPPCHHFRISWLFQACSNFITHSTWWWLPSPVKQTVRYHLITRCFTEVTLQTFVIISNHDTPASFQIWMMKYPVLDKSDHCSCTQCKGA